MNTEIYDKAHDIMRQRRKKAQDENDALMQKICTEIPEIREINNSLFNTGMELIKIAEKGGNISENIEKVRCKNLESQEKIRNLLIAHGYSPDYLDIRYNCQKCSDTGYINSNFCDCMKQLFGQLMAKDLNKNTYLELSRFEDFDLKYYRNNDYRTMKRILDFTRNYAENFTPGDESIMMSGNTGLGKTHLSLAIAERVIRKGFAVIYDSAVNILGNIEDEHFSYEHSRKTLDAVLSTDLLILDDLGTEYDTKFCNSMIFNIIDTRINRKKSTIISTNLNLGDISKRYERRIASRLSANYTQIQFSGEDVRLQKRIEQLGGRK